MQRRRGIGSNGQRLALRRAVTIGVVRTNYCSSNLASTKAFTMFLLLHRGKVFTNINV